MSDVVGFVAEFLNQHAALIVSICALFLTVNQAMATRRHNRLIVRPHLTSFTERILDPERDGIVLMKATLSNNGLGPAIIKTYELLHDGKPLEAEQPGDIFRLIEPLIPANLIADECYFTILRKGAVLAKDQTVAVATISVAMTIHVNEADIRSAVDRFQIRVTYESAYGEKFMYDSREHFSAS